MTIWFGAGLAMALLEFALPGLVAVFFGIGAWVVTSLVYFNLIESLDSQMLVFGSVSLAMLFFLRKGLYKRFKKIHSPSAERISFIGESVLVIEDVVPDKFDGRVEYKNAIWCAISDEYICTGETAKITAIEGLIFKIKRVGQSPRLF